MGRVVELLRVFVASPSDVDEERLALEKVIDEVNRTVPDQYGIRLDLIRFESHTYPGFGADPQDVINTEIGDDYDVFVGIMWARFGTPTHRAGSGTEEEFERALIRLKGGCDKLHVMMYFKDAPIEPSKIDLEQFSLVQDFKRSIEARGGYTWIFRDTPEFVQNSRLHLMLYLRDRSLQAKRGQASKLTETIDESVLEPVATKEGDLGLLDYLELFDDSMSRLRTFANNASESMVMFNARFKSRTETLALFNQPGGASNWKEGKKVISKASHDLDDLSNSLKNELENFSSNIVSAVDAFQGALRVVGDFNKSSESEKEYLQEQVERLIQALSSSCEGITAFRSSVASMPRATLEFNRAKRNAIGILDAMVEEFQKAVRLFSGLVDPIQKL